MVIVNVKEVLKEFNLAKKHFKRAIELGKKSVVVGEIRFTGTEKKVRTRSAKFTPEPEISKSTTGQTTDTVLSDTDKGLGDLPEDKNEFYTKPKRGRKRILGEE